MMPQSSFRSQKASETIDLPIRDSHAPETAVAQDIELKQHVPVLHQSLSVILPAYNEEDVIVDTIRDVINVVQQWSREFEVIVVNDGSQDQTGVLLASVAQLEPRIHIVTHEVNRGYGAALASGFAASSRELAFFMDSDGQFDIRDLAKFFPYIDQYDAVIGYRTQRQDTWMRKLNAWGWKMVVRALLGINVRDLDCAFKLYHADFIHRHRFETQGAMINAEILYKLRRDGGTFKEIGVLHLPRKAGRATGANIKVIVCAFYELLVYARKWRREPIN